MTILKSFVKKTHIGWVELRSNHLVEAMWLKDPAAKTATLEAGIDAAESEASEKDSCFRLRRRHTRGSELVKDFERHDYFYGGTKPNDAVMQL
jgi:hypothetical protein